MANRTTRTPKKEAAFLDALRDGQSVTAACIDAGFARRTVYDWRDADDAFRDAWDDAVDEGTDRMEDEAYRRAVQGTSKPVYQGKELVGHVQEYSDTLMIFMLKARRPEKFKDRVAAELSGPNGGPIETKDASAEALIDEAKRLGIDPSVILGEGGRASKA